MRVNQDFLLSFIYEIYILRNLLYVRGADIKMDTSETLKGESKSVFNLST